MSTAFEVYPGTSEIPSFNQVVNLSNERLKVYLSSIHVHADIAVNVELRECMTNKVLHLDLKKPFKFDDTRYAWFTVGSEMGGSDSYFRRLYELDKDVWEAELASNMRAKAIENHIQDSLKLGYYWYFRRSVGQPSMVNLTYGIIAASLAQLTKGFIFTDDGAWEYRKFPTTAEDFFSWYFRPELSSYENDRSWSRECVSDIIQRYGAIS